MSKTHFYGRVAAEKIFSDYLRRTFTDPQDGLICCRIRGAWALWGRQERHSGCLCTTKSTLTYFSPPQVTSNYLIPHPGYGLY